MRYLTVFLLLVSMNIMAQEKEGDLALPVSDLQIEKQEEELPPTIDQVEMKQEHVKPSKDKKPGKKHEQPKK